MAHIKEPKGIDFLIQSEPLTDEARREISDFIKDYKSKTTISKTKKKNHIKRAIPVH